MTNCMTARFLVIPALVAKMKRPRMTRSLVNGRDVVWATGLDDLGSRAFAALCRFLLVLGDFVLAHVHDDAGSVGGSRVDLILLTCKYM